MEPASESFHSFPNLPPELRLRIWNMTITVGFIRIEWDAAHRRFKSDRRPPALLHACQESRREGLKTYQLSFSPAPDLARIYVNYDIDNVCIFWKTLGPPPGRLARKLNDEECAKIKFMLFKDEDLLDHAEDGMRELGRFTGLETLAVICDPDREDKGSEWGAREMSEFSELADFLEEGEVRKELWPRLEHLEVWPGRAQCSRHWWFEGWNQRAAAPQMLPWQEALTECLQLTDENDDWPGIDEVIDEDTDDELDFWDLLTFFRGNEEEDDPDGGLL